MINNKWDVFFLKMAALMSTMSKDPSTQTGAVIVRPDNTVASLGYNGFARGCDDSSDFYADRLIKYSKIIHCEMNAILTARERLDGYTLYTYPFLTCDRCAVHVIQAGIKKIISWECPDHLKARWEESFQKARQYYAEAEVLVTEIKNA